MTKVVKVILKAETGKADANLKKVNKSLKTTEKQAKETSGKMSSAFDALPASIQGAIGQVKNLGTSFKALAVGGGVAAIAGLGSLFVMATKKGAEFAKQMSTLEAVSGASSAEMDKMANSAKELGASTQFTAKQVGELQTEFAKMGFSTDQILASTEATLGLAASMEVGLAEAATLAGSTVNAFGLKAEDTQRVVDVLAKSTSTSALDFNSLTESLKVAAPIAKATGREIEEVTAMLGVLANTGLKGSVAGTGLSKTFIELNKKGIELKDALEQVNQSSDGLNTAIELVGVVGAKSLLNLSSKSEDIDRLTESFKHSEGAAKSMAEVRLDNLAGDTTKLGSAWEGFLLSIEDGTGRFNGIIRSIVQATTALLNFITPTEDLTKALKDEKSELMLLEAQIFSANVPQKERVQLITELKDKYPELLKNIDAETVSNKELKKSLQLVNKELVNKIIIQQKQDEINEQAEISADKNLDLLSREQELQEQLAYWVDYRAERGLPEFEFDDQLTYFENLAKFGEQIKDEGLITNTPFVKKINKINFAQKQLDESLEDGNKLLEEKNALYERLGISIEETTEATEETTEANKNLQLTNSSLIEDQEFLLEQAKQLPESTEKEIIAKNRKIAAINKEIKRLKTLGVEEVKQIKNTRDLILLKQQELKEIQNTEAKTRDEIAARNDKVKAIQAEIKELQRLSLKKLDIERLDTESLPKLQKREAQKVDVRTSSEEQVNRYVRKVNDNYTGYFIGESEKRTQIILQENAARLDITSNVLSSVENLTRAFGERNEENAKKAFNVQKALGIAQVGINTASAIMKVAAETTDPTPVQAFRVGNMIAMGVAGAAQIAAIAMQKFQPSGGTASVTTPNVDTSGGGTSPTQPPSFNVVGQSGFNQIAGALGQQPPAQAFVVAGDVTTAQQLANNTIQQATF